MKKFIQLYLLAFLLASCNRSATDVPTSTANDSLITDANNMADATDTSNFSLKDELDGGNRVADTTLLYHQVSYSIKINENKIYNAETSGETSLTDYKDHSIFLTIIDGKELIISEREISRKDFASIIPKDEIELYQFSDFDIDREDKKGIGFYIIFCIPDTDMCYPIDFYVTNTGEIKISEINEPELIDL